MLEDFAVFILSHGRADNVITYRTLQRAGYTGRVFIIIDNEDKQADRYYQNFGDKVIMFDKAAEAEKTDDGDNFQDYRAVVYARNACFEIAERMKIKFFMTLDDDYSALLYRINGSFEKPTGRYIIKTRFDYIIQALLNYYQSANFSSIAIAQGGDFIGGMDNGFMDSLGRRRKCMNSFICSSDRRFNFYGKINEDTTSNVVEGGRGKLFLTIPLVSLLQVITQTNEGGLTDIYLDAGTYIKSMYTILYAPSCVRVKMLNSRHPRLHHQINWETAVPCIIRETHRKVDQSS